MHERTEVSIIRKVTLVGFWINLALVTLKLFFGYYGHSDALVADGYHSLSDFITDFIVLFLVGIAYKTADKGHPYGHGKYETVASVMIGIILIIIAFFIGTGSIIRIIDVFNGKVLMRPDIWTIIIAFSSIVLKEFCYRYTVHIGHKISSTALIANALHHRSDAYSSIAALIGISLSFILGESWRILDPIASVIVAVFIGISAFSIVKSAMQELLEISLPEKQISDIFEIIRSVPEVKKVHNLRSRRNGHSYIVDVNIHVDGNMTIQKAHGVADEVERRLNHSFGQDMIIYVHVEPE